MKRRTRWILGAGLTLLGGVLVWAQLQRAFTEQPDYRVLRRAGDLEIRAYGARVVATTPMTDSSKNEGFRVLAGYIFGGNHRDARIAMTSPVEMGEGRSPGGTSIAMTSPVETEAVDGARVMRFTMPSRWTLDSLPTPDDPRVTLREAPPETVAVLAVSGRPTEAEFIAHCEAALEAVRRAGLTPAGAPRVAQYDPPWTLGLLRRNEILVPIADDTPAS